MLASLFGKIDKLPALLQIHRTGHFNGCMFAIQHSTLGNGKMVVPVGSNIYKVNIRPFTNFLVSLLTAIDSSWRKTCLTKIILALLGTSLLIIAEGDNLYTWNIGKTLDSTRTSHTQTHESNTNGR
jgi:hypothetical protein